MKGKRLLAGMVLALALGGAQAVEHDPWEGFNRKVFRFNEEVDRWVAKPVAKTYRRVTPKFVDEGVTNFFSNAGEPLVALNNLLQGKWRQAGTDSARFLVNTTVGLVGLVDVATKLELPKHEEDFGQTMAVWGSKSGPYLMLPLYGPSTVRDAFGRVVQWPLGLRQRVEHDPTRWSLFAADAVDTRADLLDAEKVLEGDRYFLLRELYLQRRDYLIHDGEGQEDDFSDSLGDYEAVPEDAPAAAAVDSRTDPAGRDAEAPAELAAPPVAVPTEQTSPDMAADIEG